MKIKRLHLNSFGKFEDKKIEFKDGLNIVYGLNESGKSTIQMFMLSMLYGTKSVSPKESKEIKEVLNKYRPWSRDANVNFGGEIEYTLGKSGYKIERSFDDNTSTNVIDNSNGQSITNKYKTSKNAEPRILENQIGINRVCFLNTIFSKQRAMVDIKSSKDFITQKLINLGESGDEDISISKSIANLERVKSEIGVTDKNSKLRGTIYSKLEAYKKELVQYNRYEEEIKNMQQQYKNKLIEVEELKKDIVRQSEQIHRRQYTLSYNEAENEAAITKEVVKSEEIDALKDNYVKYTNNLAKYECIKAEINNIAVELNKTKEILKDVDTEKLNAVEVSYITVCNEIATCKQHIKASETILEEKQKSLECIRNVYDIRKRLITILIAIFTVISFAGSIFNIACLAGLLLSIGLGSSLIYIANNFKKTETQLLNNMYEITEKNKNNFALLEKKQEVYKTMCNEFGEEPSEVYDKIKKLKELGAKHNKLDIHFQRESLSLKAVQSELQYQFKEIVQIVSKILGDNIDINNIDKIVDKIIEQYEGFDEKLEITQEASYIDKDIEELKSLKSQFKLSKEKLIDMENEIDELRDGIRRKINNIKNSIESKEAILFKIEYYTKKYEDIKTDLRAIDLAIKALEESKEVIQKEYGEFLVSSIGKNINKLTQGRYSTVNVKNIVNIDTINDESKEISIEGLSGGTIDQFYFAWRLAVADLMSNKYNLPVIVDEPFAQYDDKRLEEAIKILGDISKDRQVIVFTCQRRDIDILKNECNMKSNIICL